MFDEVLQSFFVLQAVVRNEEPELHPNIEETPVLIAGAGPAGLVAAATLARSGIGSLVVDSRPAPSRLPRANSINMAAMELFRSWGL